MNTQTMPRPNEDAPLEGGPITTLRKQLEQRAPEYAMVLPSHITPDRLQRTVLTVAQGSPALLACDRRTLLTACMKAAQDGLLPDGREAAIVPFNTRMKVDGEWKWLKLAQYMPMVFGLRKKILQTGEITDIFTAVVYQQEIDAGRFIYEEGTERMLRHKPILESSFRPKDEDIAAAYSVATFSNGFKSFEVMRRYEIDEVRESSQTGALFDAKGEPRDAKGPWVDWFSEMAKKTVMRRHSKTLPQSSDILGDVEAEDMAYQARATAALLDSRQPDAPEPAEPPPVVDTPDHDPETGEVLEGGDGRDPEPEPVPLTEEPEPAPIPPPGPGFDPSDPGRADFGTKSFKPKGDPQQSDSREDLAETDEPDPGTDEMGITKSEHDAIADGFIERARHCELLVDLRKLERDAELQLAQMPPEIASVVDAEFAKARTRIAPPKQRAGGP